MSIFTKKKTIKPYSIGATVIKTYNQIVKKPRLAKIYLVLIWLFINYLIGMIVSIQEKFLSFNEWGIQESFIWVILNPFNILIGIINTFSSNGLAVYSISIIVILGIFVWAKDSFEKYELNQHNFGFYEVSRSGTHGTAHFATRKEVEKILNITTFDETEDFLIGMLDDESNEVVSTPLDRNKDIKANFVSGHIGVIGSSGAGKSTRFLIQNILNTISRGDSAVITDPKGEIAAETIGFAKASGYKVRILNTVNPRKSDGWDLFGEIIKSNPKDYYWINESKNELDPDYYNELSLDVQSTTEMVFRVTGNRNSTASKADFYEGNERVLFRSILWKILQDPQFSPTVNSFYEILTDSRLSSLESGGALRESYSDFLTPDKQGYKDWLSFTNISPFAQRAAAVSSLINRLSIFSSDYVREMLSADEIDLMEIAEEKCIYYLIMSDTESTFELITSSFFMFAFNRWQKEADSRPERRLKQRIILFMEEAPNIGYIPDFDKKIAVFRSRGINIIFIAQTMPQMMRMFPQKDYDTIMGNFGIVVLLKSNDPTTNEYFSKKADVQTIVTRNLMEQKPNSVENGLSSYREGISEGKRNLINPSEIQGLEFDEMITFAGGLVIKMKKMNFDGHPDSVYLKDLPFDIREYRPEWYQQYIQKREETKAYYRLKKETDNNEHMGIRKFMEQKTAEYQEKQISEEELLSLLEKDLINYTEETQNNQIKPETNIKNRRKVWSNTFTKNNL